MTEVAWFPSWIAALSVAALVTLAPAAQAQDYSETCRYFSGQAFKDRRLRGHTTFRMDLAQDCVDALVYARAADPAVRRRALAYLDQLQSYRRVMVDMLVDRARARAGGVRDTRRHVKPAVAPISWAGAYLIARRMGLVETHETWTAWRQASAADPRVQIE